MSIKIGFSNLAEQNVFARELRLQLEQAAAQQPDIQLIVRDNRHDTEQAVANIEEFVLLAVDIAIVYHIDERAGMRLSMPLRLKRIPLIAVEFQLPLAVSIGIDNRAAGEMSGREGGKWIQEHWSGKVDKLVIFTDSRVISAHRDRFMSALEVLNNEYALGHRDPLWVDSGTEAHLAAERFAELLQSWGQHHQIAIMTMGDVVSRGVIEAARMLGREQDIAVMSFDGTEWAQAELKNPASRLIVSPYFNLERYCQQILALARSILEAKPVPKQTFVQPMLFARNRV